MKGNTNDESKPRQIKDAPFCWQHKETLHMIRDIFENGHGIAAIPISVYVALTELASNAQSETFTARISEIARRSGVSYRSAADFLNRFESLKLIAIERRSVEGTKEKLPSTYTLLIPLGTPCLTLGKREARRLPRLKKNWKNIKKLNTATTRSDGSTRNVKSKLQRPASPGLEGKEKDSDWPRRTPLHVLKRRREQYQNERSQLLREYGNGAFSDTERLDRFLRDAPPEVQRRYNWLRPTIKKIEQAIAHKSRP
jgi:hypothetical protein